MEETTNSRGYTERTSKGQHLHLTALKREARSIGYTNQYMDKVDTENILDYPHPEFRVGHLKHDTGRNGLTGIKSDGGFRACSNNLLWWSLYVTSEDIISAETRLLDDSFPERTEEQARMQQHFLGKFATSPAFLETSRLGSYRFTFPLNEVLGAYKEQFCSGEDPIMRVLSTTLYKQEVMFAVVVHSPANEKLFAEYPLLHDEPDSICAFRDGRFIWRPEAMCETHRFELIRNNADNQMEAVEQWHGYYLWDHVAITLHMEDGEVLRFDSDRLRANLQFCEKGSPVIKRSQYASPSENFDTYSEAEDLVNELWDSPSSLERSPKIQ